MTILKIKIRFFFHCLRRQIKSCLLRLGCHFFFHGITLIVIAFVHPAMC